MAKTNLFIDTPRHLSLGAQDNSGGTIPYEPEKRALHVPLFYCFAPKGKPNFYGEAADQIEMFTAQAFDETGKYITHSTLLRNFLIANGDPNGGAGVVRRLIPKDNVTPANVTVWVDVLETMIPEYERNSDGSLWLDDITNQKVKKGYVKGLRIKWYKSSQIGNFNLGEKTNKQGSMSKWTIGDEETEAHIVKTDYDIEGTTTGHIDYANKTVYVYDTVENLWSPVSGVTTRRMYTVDGTGNRVFGPEEQTFGTTPGVSTLSTIYPIFEVKASQLGSWYNLTGFSIESLFGSSATEDIIEKKKHLPYNFYLYTKDDEASTGKSIKNVNGDTYSSFTFENKSINPITEAQNGFEYTVKNLLFNESDVTKSVIYRFFENVHFYRKNYVALTDKIGALEAPLVSTTPLTYKDGIQASNFTWYDYTEESDINTAFGLMNPMTCKTTKQAPLQTAVLDTDAPTHEVDGFEEVAIGSNAPIYLKNGEDGTMTEEVFEQLVREDLDNYLDEDHIYQDLGLSYETHLYDSGFELETKKKLGQFISLRKDTVLNASTVMYSDRDKNRTIEEQRNFANILLSGARMYPESTEYGTSCMRFSTNMGNGQYEDKDYRYPATFDLAVKTAKLMGGKEQKFNMTELFDCGSKAIVNTISDVYPQFIPPSIKNSLRKSGVNYWESGGSVNEFFYPALQTVYSDKTSIANSYINVLCVAVCERIAWSVWRALTGDTRSSVAQFAERGRSIAAEKITGVFGNFVTVVPEFTVTTADQQRGYTWHLVYKIYGNVSKRVQVYSTKLYRTEALETK